MAIAVFLIIYFVLLVFGATPLVLAIATACFSIPLFFSATADFGLVAIASSFAEATFANNTGITVLLFILAGDVMSHGAITEKIFNIFAYFLGKRKGFMPILSILTCMFYGAISGSGPATTAAVGAMCFPVLVSMGYDKFFSAALLVCAGCLGMVIPPSVPVTGVAALTNGLDIIVLYKVATIVGVACGVLMIVYSYVYCLRHGNGDQVKINAWVDRLRDQGFGYVVKDSIWALLTPIIILGSIFSGFADTAQAAALSLVYAIIISVFVYKTISLKELPQLLMKSLRGGAGMLMMLAFATVFSNAMSALNVNQMLENLVNATNMSGLVVMIFILLYMLIMGAFGAGASVTLVIPLAYPLMIATGVEPFTACISVVLMQAVGLVTPPIGLCLFVMADYAKCEVSQLTKSLIPFILIMVVVSLFLILFPGVFSGIVAGGTVPIP